MEQKRFVLALVLSFAILMGWQMFVVPRFFPVPKPVARQPAKPRDDAKPGQAPADSVDGANVANKDRAEPPSVSGKSDGDKPAERAADAAASASGKEPAPVAAKLPVFPPRIVKLGSIEEDAGYRLYVKLTSRGAAVEQIELNNRMYRDLAKGHPPLKIVSAAAGTALSLQTKVPDFGVDLTSADWEVVQQTESDATFRMPSPDGALEVLKHYSLKKRAANQSGESASLYELHFDLTFRNKSRTPRTLTYELLGPVGMPLENVDNTQKFRDVVVGFVGDKGAKLLTSSAIAKGSTEIWERPIRWIGVDVQYFAALLVPKDDQEKSPYFKTVTQTLLGPKLQEKSDISVLLTSRDLELAPAGVNVAPAADSITHAFELYAGPKRDDLLAEFNAEKVIQYGMFGWISQPMLALLKTFYALFQSYGVAIICLTVLVRCCMFPLSIKQARSAAKMQELQPEMAALKEKFGKDREKMARAQMELYSKHNFNPLGGCMLVFVQLPVFMGLYQALSNAVDLRSAKFLWIDNLAAPDALFDLPFRVPFVGWNQFNLLPILTIVLFIVQQKMLMPPPTNDEEALRNKMMNFMMVFMGFMFYKVPAGLCVYFIASSLWGLGERKLLPKAQKKTGSTVIETTATSTSSRGDTRPAPAEPVPDGFLARLLKAADKESQARNTPQGRGSAGKRR